MRGELSRARIVEAALALVDAAGLDGLSMRRLGAALHVEGMAIYHHFANKGALVDAVVASVLPEPPPPTGDWRADLTAHSHRYRAMVNAHPRLLPALVSRPGGHDRAAATREAQYAALRLAGLDGSTLLDAHRTWGSYVLGYVVVEQQGRAGSFTEAAWRPPEGAAFPVSAALDAHQATRDWDEQFDVGLSMILDAIAALAR
jgi:AcrR family transcriptional regulator